MCAILNNSRAFIGFCLALSLDLGSNALIICNSFQRTMFFPGLNSPTTTIKDEQWKAESSEQQHDQDVVMPGFRFHPTEEELVEFYLRRKVEGKHFNIDLITFVDLYRYDPWELPALAAIGEKEWFFYVPRDRKYRNGDRPNRVTTSGYWKATGADRTIRNENLRCIGLKKTLVFYTGKAPKGTRTNWIMNEYRLPQFHETDSVGRNQKNELSLCRVYRKAGSDQDPRLQCKKSHKMINVAENENHQSSFVELNNYLTASHHTIPNSRAAGNANRTDLNSKNMAVDLGNLEVSSMEVKSNLSTDGRLHHSIEYGGERIYSEPSNVTGGNLWNVSTPRSLNEEVELSLSSCLCSRALDQMHMVEDLCNQSHVVVTNNSMYGFPTGCSDKLWEWNPVRNN